MFNIYPLNEKNKLVFDLFFHLISPAAIRSATYSLNHLKFALTSPIISETNYFFLSL
jgi:hypothetical protein